eukprot:10089-Eustigmatos_ZCMA.PRE.1
MLLQKISAAQPPHRCVRRYANIRVVLWKCLPVVHECIVKDAVLESRDVARLTDEHVDEL